MPGNADITAVVTCFNYGAYLRECVESLRAQEGGPPRILVVDDGSTDAETLEVLGSLPDDVEVLRQDNRGVAHARNSGLGRVRTPYAIVIDADDRLPHDALARMRAPLDRDPKLGFTYGTMRFFGDWEGEMRMPPYDPYRLLHRHTIGATCLARSELFEGVGGYDPEFTGYEDWELWLHALAQGWRGLQVEGVTAEYRRHGETKLRADRRHYRTWFRRLRRKHRALYVRRGEFARESDLSATGRVVYRFVWGWRPVPGWLEHALHSVYFGRRS